MAGVLRHLAKLDIPGGGQVVAEGDYAYIGHMGPPDGTSIVDVSDPRKPRIVSRIEVPSYMHSHKVRVHGDIMMVNNEPFRAGAGGEPADFAGGIKVYDVTDKTKPRQIGHYKSGGSHRFDSDGRYAYISSEEEGYLGDIVVILDMADPTKPDGDRQMVDAGAMDRRRRDSDLAGAAASLPPPAAPRQPALYQLLAWWLCDPRCR